MGTVEKAIMGIIALIAIYLFIFNGEKTSMVISNLAEGGATLVATLQGRGGFGAGRLTGIGI